MLHHVILPALRFSPAIKNFVVGSAMPSNNHLPANLATQLVVYLRGGSSLIAKHAAPARLPSAFIGGPSLKPLHFHAEPGSAFVAATIRSDYLSDYFDIPSGEIAHQIIPLEDAVAPHLANSLQENIAYARNPQQVVACMESFLDQARMHKRHTLLLLPRFSATELQLPGHILAAASNLGVRQFERRFRQHYGVSLRDYRRLARFNTALATLIAQVPERGVSTRIAQDSGYFDDAHFSRDFQDFIGAAPGKFIKTRNSDESAYRLWRFNQKDMQAFID
ncbi:helix-turn-helix domain-containing protein [Herminiimonas fonticola]|uniref:AraC family transcriptional regulator n=1 Tax=Herminiimonas fonticola TaxID=303380 RepID=UPI00333F38D8